MSRDDEADRTAILASIAADIAAGRDTAPPTAAKVRAGRKRAAAYRALCVAKVAARQAQMRLWGQL